MVVSWRQVGARPADRARRAALPTVVVAYRRYRALKAPPPRGHFLHIPPAPRAGSKRMCALGPSPAGTPARVLAHENKQTDARCCGMCPTDPASGTLERSWIPWPNLWQSTNRSGRTPDALSRDADKMQPLRTHGA